MSVVVFEILSDGELRKFTRPGAARDTDTVRRVWSEFTREIGTSPTQVRRIYAFRVSGSCVADNELPFARLKPAECPLRVPFGSTQGRRSHAWPMGGVMRRATPSILG